MDPVLLVALAALLIVLGLALSVYRDGPSVLPNMFRYHGPEWPHGVQEDDDARFSWNRPRPDPMQPVLEELHGKVRAGR
jgi:hypothetical protein